MNNSLQIYFFPLKWRLANKKWVDLQAISAWFHSDFKVLNVGTARVDFDLNFDILSPEDFLLHFWTFHAMPKFFAFVRKDFFLVHIPHAALLFRSARLFIFCQNSTLHAYSGH